MSEPPPLDDPEVWNNLIAAVHPDSILVVIGYRLGPELRNRVAAEDILQEALLKAWRARARFTWRGVPAFRRWLLTIAENCIEDERDRGAARKRSAERAASSLAPPPTSGGPSSVPDLDPWTSTTPSRMLETRERAAAMARTLEALPDDVREVVRLRLFEDLAIDDIASRLALGESAVRHRFRKGAELYRAGLQTALGGSSLGAVGAPIMRGAEDRIP
jgi:RNA polymerase sigma-70 factor (ECF subfamily)